MAPSTCGASSRSRCSAGFGSSVIDAKSPSLVAAPLREHHGVHLDRHVERLAAYAGRRRGARRELVGALRRLDVDDPVAREHLFRLGKWPIGDRGRAVLGRAHDPHLLRAAEALGAHEFAGVDELLVEPLQKIHVRFRVLLRPELQALGFPERQRELHHQYVLHRLLLRLPRPAWALSGVSRSPPTTLYIPTSTINRTPSASASHRGLSR